MRQIKAALRAAMKCSPSQKCKVGAIMWDESLNELRAIGWNYGAADIVGDTRFEVYTCCGGTPSKPLSNKPCEHCGGTDYSITTLSNVVHAEVACVTNYLNDQPAHSGLKLYVTRQPCEECRKYLNKLGIRWEVVLC